MKVKIKGAIKFRLLPFYMALLCFTLTSCSKYIKEPKQYSEKEALEIMLELTPVECSDFYRINYKLNSFLDSLYVEEILPCFQQIPLPEFKSAILKLKDTPAEEYACTIYEDLYDDLISDLADELDSITFIQQQAFSEDLMPIIEVALDSIICADLEFVIEEYSGGFLNYRKLGLFTGKDSNDFAKKWNEIVDKSRYTILIQDFVNDYLSLLRETNNQYMEESIGKTFPLKNDIEFPKVNVSFNDECLYSVAAFNSREKSGMFKEFLKDWVAPAALAVVTGGASTIVNVYEAANFGYDIMVTVDEIQKMEPTSEEVLMYECASSIEEQIYKYCLNPLQESVFSMIEKQNTIILNEIAQYHKL